MSIFLDSDDIANLTGRKFKSCQVKQLRAMGIPFHVNASGRPVVAKSAVEGGEKIQSKSKKWQPNGFNK